MIKSDILYKKIEADSLFYFGGNTTRSRYDYFRHFNRSSNPTAHDLIHEGVVYYDKKYDAFILWRRNLKHEGDLLRGTGKFITESYIWLQNFEDLPGRWDIEGSDYYQVEIKTGSDSTEILQNIESCSSAYQSHACPKCGAKDFYQGIYKNSCLYSQCEYFDSVASIN